MEDNYDFNCSDNDESEEYSDYSYSKYVFKTIIVFGANEVGKTTLIRQLITNKFTNEYNTTLVVDYYDKTIDKVKLLIWDKSGNELNENTKLNDFLSCPSINTYKTASAFIIMSSYDNFESINITKKYIDIIKKLQDKLKIPAIERQPIIALINKKDLTEKKFTFNDAYDSLIQYLPSILVGQISCKSTKTVHKFFERLVEKLNDDHQSNINIVDNGMANTLDVKKSANPFFNETFIIEKSLNTSGKLKKGKKGCC